MKKFSTISINIILISIILIIVLLQAGYKINLLSYLNKTNEFITSKNNLTSEVSASLVKCIDGDTAQFKIDNQIQTIRFLAIDTPELKESKYKDTYLGLEASSYTCHLLTNNIVTVAFEKGIYDKDKYNRRLAWVYVNSTLIQEKLVKSGYAKVRYIYAKYTYTDKLLKWQKEAMEDKLGIWSSYQASKYEGDYVVVFKIGENVKSVDVSAGDLVKIIDNPLKKGYKFAGWEKDGKLYDLSRPITSNIIVKAKFIK